MTLRDLANYIYDLYNQDYAPNDKFIDVDDVKYWIAGTYSTLLNAEFQADRRENKKESGFSNTEISAAWLLEEELTIEEDESKGKISAKTSYPIFSFNFDNTTSSLQGIHSIGNPHCIYRKISLTERRFRQITPPSSAIFYYVNSDREIVFWGAVAGRKIKVQYVPKVDVGNDNCMLSDNMTDAITDTVLKRLFAAQSGTVVDEVDDQNSNKIAQQQVNPNLNK